MPDQFKIVVAELVKILRVKATTPAPLESSCDGPTAGSGAGRDGEGIAEGANVTENESEGGKVQSYQTTPDHATVLVDVQIKTSLPDIRLYC